MKIKSDKQLEALKISVDVMSDKFEEYKKDLKNLRKSYKQLTGQLVQGNDSFIWITSDDSNQYSRRNCLQVHGLKEQK